MAKHQSEFFSEVRRQEICALVQAENAITVKGLCDRFHVSPATIRTDLSDLDAKGLLKRTHGGAISNRSASHELTTREKASRNIAAKASIAKAALKFIHPGEAIGIDTGTTGMELAKLLGGIADLTVVTNDLEIALYLEQNTEVSVYLLGGLLRKNFHCTCGDQVLDALDRLHINSFFLATNGISLQRGLSTPNIEMARTKRKFIDAADQVILMADESKLSSTAFAYFASLKDIDVFISNADLQGELDSVPYGDTVRYIRTFPSK